MNRLHNAWRPILLGLVLLSVLVEVAGAVPTDQPSALGTPRQYVICAADFYASDDFTTWTSNGQTLNTTQNGVAGWFEAPIDLPVPNWATIDKFELFALDNNNAGNIRAFLYLSKPSTGSDQVIASIDTLVAYVSSDDPHTWQTTAISPNVKNPANDLYVWLGISDDTNLSLYGVRIWYRVGK